MKHARLLFLTISSFLVISCNDKVKYSVSIEQADLINRPKDGVIVDRIGGEGPFVWTGGLQTNLGETVTFRVRVNGVDEKKEFEGKPNIFYITQNFKNESGDGYMVIYQRTVSQPNEFSQQIKRTETPK